MKAKENPTPTELQIKKVLHLNGICYVSHKKNTLKYIFLSRYKKKM